MSFNPIKSHQMGPTSIEGTEFGDTWVGAMDKCNAMFKELYGLGAPAIAAVDTAAAAATNAVVNATHEAVTETKISVEDAHAKIAFLESALSDALFKLDSHTAALDAIASHPALEIPPLTPENGQAVSAALPPATAQA
jgi:hypothetical protein